MKIAFVVPYVPNLIRTRPYNLIVHLTSLGHDVDVFTVGSGAQDLLDAELLRKKCKAVHFFRLPVWRSLWNSVWAVFSSQPLQTVYSWHSGMAEALAEHIERNEFNVVHVEHLRGSRYARFVKTKFPTMPVIWDSVDCISHLFQQASGQSSSFFGKFVTRFELPRTRKAEGNLICSFDHTLITSSTDKEALLALAPDDKCAAPMSVLPNGVDLEYFEPVPEVQREPETVVFSGKMSYHANIAMVKFLVTEIMPQVWAKRPATKLIVVGKDPDPDIREFGKDPLITVTGTVADIRPFLWRSTVSVVPLLYGAGIQNKILEAMATRTPVVTTSRTLSALEAVPGSEVLVADTADALASAVLQLIENKSLGDEIGSGGLLYVQKKHAWKNITSRLVDIYRTASHYER
jgi:glycosyltransferase involved in cell wall biosynthesis